MGFIIFKINIFYFIEQKSNRGEAVNSELALTKEK